MPTDYKAYFILVLVSEALTRYYQLIINVVLSIIAWTLLAITYFLYLLFFNKQTFESIQFTTYLLSSLQYLILR